MIGRIEISSQRRNMLTRHLKEQNIGYFEHWWRAMKISGALFVHAFLPDILSDYASKEINNNE